MPLLPSLAEGHDHLSPGRCPGIPFLSNHWLKANNTARESSAKITFAKRMKSITARIALVVLFAAAATSAAEEPKFNNKQLDFFEKNIRPVLAEKCYSCHHPDEKVKGGLALHTREALLEGGDSGNALIPGNPAKSLLIKAIVYEDDKLQMPPKERLSDAEIRNFQRWVRMGAPDPRIADANHAKKADGIDIDEARSHWAFQPISDPQPPRVANPKFVANDIDAFVAAKHAEKKLSPNPLADKRTLIRRATYDLTGLPPAPEEVRQFLNDESPDAFEVVIDRLLKSPHYGERWGRHWLDVARYADTSGDRRNRGENRYPFAWTYRDYVIQAFNEDKPFHQFVKEQIAADFLVDANAKDRSALAALGFLTVGKRFQGNANEIIDDRIDVVTQGFLGLTASCARCHDHKFDPIPTKDYYSLHGVFASSEEPDSLPYLREPERTPDYLKFEQELTKLKTEYDAIRPNLIDEALDEMRAKTGEYLLASYEAGRGRDFAKARALYTKRKLNVPAATFFSAGIRKVKEDHPELGPWIRYSQLPAKKFGAQANRITDEVKNDERVNPAVRQALADGRPTSMAQVARVYGRLFADVHEEWRTLEKQGKATKAGLPDKDREAVRKLIYSEASPIHPARREINRIVNNNTVRRAQTRLAPKIFKLETEHPASPARAMALRDTRRPRDSRVLIRGEARNFGDDAPRRFLEILSDQARKPYANGSGRLELAEDIAHPDNPLTARVIVNRVWAWHFGSGLLETTSDFGLRSEEPLHRDLLDHLATWFVKNGWSLKKLHKYIMLSSVYRLSSADNGRYAEIDPGNEYLWKFNLQRLDFESLRDSLLAWGGNIDLALGGRPVDLEVDDYPLRRTLYGEIDRENLPEIFRTFDFANPDMTANKRALTTVPQQALFMMNSPFVIEQAKKMIERSDVAILHDKEDRIQFLYQLVYQRDPSDSELNQAWDFLAAQEKKVASADETDAWSYGYGVWDARNKRLRFQPLRAFELDTWSATRRFPDPRMGRLSLTAEGGHAGKDARYAVVRRWTAPADDTVDLRGKLAHQAEAGDGIRALLVSSRQGELGQWTLDNDFAITEFSDIEVKQGETLDFLVFGRENDKGDAFEWAPRITGGRDRVWDANAQFSGPRIQNRDPLTPWQKLAQALFLTNEAIFVN